jgi:hypothetical protein
MRSVLVAAAALAVTAASVPASAHHSLAMFDTSKEMTITGKVKEFQWTNPHCYIQVVVEDGTGKPVEWSIEMGAPMYLYARGWRPSTLKPGSEISVKVNPLRNGRPGGVVLAVTDASGNPVGKGV